MVVRNLLQVAVAPVGTEAEVIHRASSKWSGWGKKNRLWEDIVIEFFPLKGHALVIMNEVYSRHKVQ